MTETEQDDDLRPEYDLRELLKAAERGKHAARSKEAHTDRRDQVKWSERTGMDVESRGEKDAGDAEEIRRIIVGAFAAIDPAQVAITRRLTPAERFQEGCSMIRLTEEVGAYRLRLRHPEMTQHEALRMIRSSRG